MSSQPTCCGKKWSTRFCGDCGKPLRQAPIDELVTHLRGRVKYFKIVQANHEKSARDYPEEAAHYLKLANKANLHWERWERRLQAVLKLLARSPRLKDN